MGAGASANPYTGTGWSDPTQSGVGGTANTGIFGNTQMPSMPTGIPNPGGYSNPQGANEINRNLGITNTQTAQYKNQLAPIFNQLFSQGGGNAMNYFNQLANLGSPYYKQQQAGAFNQGVQQNQNAQGMAQQQLQQQGYGYTPSGAEAGMIGGMQQQGAQNLAEQYLQNLFQNENLQLQGAQGLAGTANMFNPSQLLGGTSLGSNVQAPPSFAQNFGAMTSGLGSLFGGYGNTSLPGA